MTTSRILTAAALATRFAVSSAHAQNVAVVGKIEGVDGPTLVIKTAQGEQKVNIAPNVAVFGVAKSTIPDIKPNSFIGVGASPQADGSPKAIRVMIFAESQRGNGEGFRPWDRPNTTMTNATVDTTVSSVDGQVVTVKYKDGEKKIVIGPDAVILVNSVGDKSEIKAGANVAFP